MRIKIIIAIVVLMIVGCYAYRPVEAIEDESIRIKIPTAYKSLYLRERQFGRADDNIDGLIAETRTIILELIETEKDEPDRVYLGLYWITGYDLCVQCCGIWSAEHPSRKGTDYVQTTASGVPNQVGVTVAAGTEFAFGTRIYIDGIGERIVQDRGVGNGCIDVLCNNHSDCADVTGWREIWLLKGEE